MNKKILYVAASILIIVSYFCYNYIYQDHRNISEESADFSISASQFNNSFVNNVEIATNTYLNKTIIVKGKVTEHSKNVLMLNNSIFCKFLSEIKTESALMNTEISVKGRCIGYDDLLGEIKLDQCTIINDK